MCGQSSTYKNVHAEYAVDGLTNTAHHTLKDQSPYWSVDLGRIYNIMIIEVISGVRLHDLDITVGTHLDDMAIFAHYTGPASDNEHLVFQRSRYTDGRYVKLTITKGPEILHVSEVIVIAYPTCQCFLVFWRKGGLRLSWTKRTITMMTKNLKIAVGISIGLTAVAFIDRFIVVYQREKSKRPRRNDAGYKYLTMVNRTLLTSYNPSACSVFDIIVEPLVRIVNAIVAPQPPPPPDPPNPDF
ncbi:unnamed protein product [Mytilus edulis]|uniref:Fucolectin tachylectin-4 pentraxin-1 domain-containing protein n=1 Tax=Mytilus edulis TaxID=6550 RepID=A0A8S3SCU4_MYTED|nr:unnamed protein product [Mytilus edulis]